MPYRLPLELELTILELVAPPLAIDSLHDRVDFFINVSLVHRSLTAWAQERLHYQFLYTYRRRSDEYERLETRLEAGFGRDRSIRRLFLDLTRFPDKSRQESAPGTKSTYCSWRGRDYAPSSLIHGAGDTQVQRQACDVVASFFRPEITLPTSGQWELCPMITAYSQVLDTLWLKSPPWILDIADLPRECVKGPVSERLLMSPADLLTDATAPRVLCLDDPGHRLRWCTTKLPVSSKTKLFLRNIDLGGNRGLDELAMRQIVFDKCRSSHGSASNVLRGSRRLETLILSETEDDDDIKWTLATLPPSIQIVHISQHNVNVGNDDRRIVNILPHLESFTFELLLPSVGSPANDGRDVLAEVQRAVESTIVAPQCTFKYARSTKSPEDALADAMAELGIGS